MLRTPPPSAPQPHLCISTYINHPATTQATNTHSTTTRATNVLFLPTELASIPFVSERKNSITTDQPEPSSPSWRRNSEMVATVEEAKGAPVSHLKPLVNSPLPLILSVTHSKRLNHRHPSLLFQSHHLHRRHPLLPNCPLSTHSVTIPQYIAHLPYPHLRPSLTAHSSNIPARG